MKLAKHTKEYLYLHTGEIINTIVPTTVKDWKCNDSTQNIFESLAILICREGESNEEKCKVNIKVVIGKMTGPLVSMITWIKEEQTKQGTQISEKQINEYVYD